MANARQCQGRPRPLRWLRLSASSDRHLRSNCMHKGVRYGKGRYRQRLAETPCLAEIAGDIEEDWMRVKVTLL